jgi:hypothetical protein
VTRDLIGLVRGALIHRLLRVAWWRLQQGAEVRAGGEVPERAVEGVELVRRQGSEDRPRRRRRPTFDSGRVCSRG